ncbi:MAG: hypothetical protein ABEJ95_03100 [Candidatus Nanohalobium sp.]
MKYDLDKLGKNLVESVKYSFGNLRKSSATVFLSVLLLVFLVLGSFPGYSLQMLGTTPAYFGEAFTALSFNLYASAGFLGLVTVLVYSIATSIAVVNIYSLIQINGGWTALKGAGGVTPGFLIGSCAGCGAGILGFLGFTGAVALLPFSGNGVRIVGILFLTYFLGKIGNPRKCRV